MSNPTVSFRISDYHLARALRAIRIIEPEWKMTTTANLIRTVFNDYIAKSEHFNNSPLEVTPELLYEIALSRSYVSKPDNQLDILPRLGQAKQPIQKPAWQVQRELAEEKLFNDLRRESLAKLQQEEQAKNDQQSQNDSYIDEQIALAEQSLKRKLPKPSEFHDPNITESKISTVTDFSPPKEWIDQEV